MSIVADIMTYNPNFLLPPEKKQVSTGIRIVTMLLDHMIMCLVVSLFFLPFMISMFRGAFTISHSEPEVYFSGTPMYIALFGLSLYYCKDIINGRSIAKRILKLQVIDNKTGKVATPLQCFVRNVFCIFWIIEVIVAMINTNRRIGDRVAGTKLVPFDPALSQPRPGFLKLFVPIILSFGIILGIHSLLPTTSLKADYNKDSYNPGISKAVENIISEKLGDYLMPDVRVYDSTSNSNLKYVSAIIRFKENFFLDEPRFNAFKIDCRDMIYSVLSKDSFKGKLQFVYQADNKFQSRIITIGLHTYP
jgi:uncharacterized RDD family membrane protein YckC